MNSLGSAAGFISWANQHALHAYHRSHRISSTPLVRICFSSEQLCGTLASRHDRSHQTLLFLLPWHRQSLNFGRDLSSDGGHSPTVEVHEKTLSAVTLEKWETNEHSTVTVGRTIVPSPALVFCTAVPRLLHARQMYVQP